MGRPSRSDATSTHQTSPLLGRETKHVDVGGGGKATRQITRQTNGLGFARSHRWARSPPSRLGRKALRRPGERTDRLRVLGLARSNLSRIAGRFADQPIEELGASFECQFMDFDHVGTTFRGGEIDDVAPTLHDQIATLLVRDDQTGFNLESIPLAAQSMMTRWPWSHSNR